MSNNGLPNSGGRPSSQKQEDPFMQSRGYGYPSKYMMGKDDMPMGMSKRASMPPAGELHTKMSRDEMRMKSMNEPPLSQRRSYHPSEMYGQGFDSRMRDYSSREEMMAKQAYMKGFDYPMQKEDMYAHGKGYARRPHPDQMQRSRQEYGYRMTPMSQNFDPSQMRGSNPLSDQFIADQYQAHMYQRAPMGGDNFHLSRKELSKLIFGREPKYPGLKNIEKEEIRMQIMRAMHTIKKLSIVYT